MRVLPILLLLSVVVPASPRVGRHAIFVTPTQRLKLCHSTWIDMRRASVNGDTSKLIGMIFPNGISVKSSDGTVSEACLKQATDAWNSGLNQTVFRLVENDSPADADVKMVEKIVPSDDLQGQIQALTAPDGKITAKVFVCRQNEGQALSSSEVGEVLTHELGHMIGLDDAPDGVPAGEYIMSSFDPDHPVLRPSAEEVQAIEELRSRIKTQLSLMEETWY